eukprot:6348064-Pyramimonas_sp.AAC.1
MFASCTSCSTNQMNDWAAPKRYQISAPASVLRWQRMWANQWKTHGGSRPPLQKRPKRLQARA